jgi:hypothetical protein
MEKKIIAVKPAERLADMEAFLTELERGIPHDERLLVGYSPGDPADTENSKWWPAPHKTGKYVPCNTNNYICISSAIQTPHEKTGKLRYWRSDANFGHGLAIMIDDIGDGKGSKGSMTIEYFSNVLQPTAVVETSPGNYQIWYFFDKPEKDKQLFKNFLRSFVDQVLSSGGDKTIKDITRFGRMPGGINGKEKYKVEGKSWIVRFAEDGWKPENRYSIEDIAKAFHVRIVESMHVKQKFDALEFEHDAIFYHLAEHYLQRMKMGEAGNGDLVMNGSGKYRILCPWAHHHDHGDTGAHFRGPIVGSEVDFVFSCSHSACQGTVAQNYTNAEGEKISRYRGYKKTWRHFTDFIVEQIAAELDAINEDWPYM